MTYIHKRSVTLLQKLKNSPFVKLNNEVYGGTSRVLGASALAENTLLANNDLLKGILPTVLGIDKNSGKWQDVVNKYFYAISVDVPKGGKVFDISLIFNINDNDRKSVIAQLIKDSKVKITTDEQLAEYVIGFDKIGNKNVDEIDIYKYAKPVNPLHYFNYIYALNHNRVANNQSLINKSPRIEFYLVTKADVVLAKRKKYETAKRITKAMAKIDTDETLFNALCSVLNITNGDEIDKGIELNNISKSTPEKILEIINDKNLMLKANIEEHIRKGIIRRLPNSSMLVDADDPTLIIGTNMDSALSFFSDAKNDAVLNQYSAKLKSLNL